MPIDSTDDLYRLNKPLLCSQGGLPYNKDHLDFLQAEINRLRSELASVTKERDELKQECTDLARDLESALKDLAGMWGSLHATLTKKRERPL